MVEKANKARGEAIDFSPRNGASGTLREEGKGTVRINFITSIALLLAMASTTSAAPISMIQGLPEATSAAPSPKAGQRNWLTKWLIGDAPVQPMPQQVSPQSGPDAFAYKAPVEQPASSAVWPSTPVTTSPIAAVEATVEATQVPSPSVSAATADAIAAAQAAEAVGNADEARRLYYEYLTANPTDVKALRELGHMEDRQGNLSHAEQHYRQALGANPASAAATNDLGLCLARQGKLEASVATFGQAIQMRPNKRLYRNNIATVQVQLGQSDEALAQLKAVYDPATATFNLGQLLVKAGKTAEAARRFQEALALEPNLIPAREALAKLQSTNPVEPVRLVETTPVVTPETVTTTPVAEPTPTTPYVASQGVPSFPRLLPPVIDR